MRVGARARGRGRARARVGDLLPRLRLRYRVEAHADDTLELLGVVRGRGRVGVGVWG